MKALSFATVFAALSGFVLMLIAARALGDVRSAELMAYWGLFFACTGFIDGLMQETTRAVAASTGVPPAPFAQPPGRGRSHAVALARGH